MANRSGGKTFDLAVLSCLDSLANDECESANLGAIQAQAQRCYRYMRQIILNSPVFSGFLRGDPTLTRTSFINLSTIEVLVATITGVNSPHPQKLKMDEIELIPWSILQEAFSMVQSKKDVKGVTVLGSTRKFASGPMQRLIDAGGDKGLKLYDWCIWEVMEAWPKDEAFSNELKKVFGADLPEDLSHFNGYYKWEDVLEKYQTLDREVWDTQWLCKKPDLSSLIYSRFDDEKNIDTNFKLDKTKQHYVWEDFGNSKDHPDVMLFVEVDMENTKVTVFDELYLSDLPSTKMVEEAKAKLAEHGMTVADLTGWIPDPHMLTQVIDRVNMGLPIWDKVDETMMHDASQLYLIANGIHVIRKFIDEKWFKITPNCTQLRGEFLSYARKRKPNGEYSEDPDKKYDHGPDACRYGIVRIFPSIAMGTFGNDSIDVGDKPITAPVITRTPKAEDIIQDLEDEEEVVDIIHKVF